MKAINLLYQRPYLLWLMIGLRELWQETKADLQNRSVLFALIALVVLPVDMLPVLYTDWMNLLYALFVHTKTIDQSNGFGFGVAIFTGLMLLSFWRRNLFGDFSQVNLLECTLPIPKINRAFNQFSLGMFCHLPVLLVVFMGAATSIFSGRTGIISIGHILTLLSFIIMSGFATGFTVLYSKLPKLADYRRAAVQHNRLNHCPKSIAWLLFLAKRLLEQERQRVLSFFIFVGLTSLIIYKKDESELVSYGVSGLILFSGLCSYYLIWFLKPLLIERKAYQSFLITTPSRLSATPLGEYFISMGLLILTLFPIVIHLVGAGLPSSRILVAAVSAAALNTVSFLANLHFPRLTLPFIGLCTLYLLYLV